MASPRRMNLTILFNGMKWGKHRSDFIDQKYTTHTFDIIRSTMQRLKNEINLIENEMINQDIPRTEKALENKKMALGSFLQEQAKWGSFFRLWLRTWMLQIPSSSVWRGKQERRCCIFRIPVGIEWLFRWRLGGFLWTFIQIYTVQVNVTHRMLRIWSAKTGISSSRHWTSGADHSCPAALRWSWIWNLWATSRILEVVLGSHRSRSIGHF